MSGPIDMAGRSTAGTILYILIGPIVWATHFAALYFIQSMLCAHGTAEGFVPIIIGAATLVAILPLATAPLLPRATAGMFHAGGWGAEANAFHAKGDDRPRSPRHRGRRLGRASRTVPRQLPAPPQLIGPARPADIRQWYLQAGAADRPQLTPLIGTRRYPSR